MSAPFCRCWITRFAQDTALISDACAVVGAAVRTKQWHATGAALSAYIQELESNVASYNSFA